MDIPFIDIAWFYLVKLLLFVIMLYFVVKPFYNRRSCLVRRLNENEYEITTLDAFFS